jgi:hypothetical protein
MHIQTYTTATARTGCKKITPSYVRFAETVIIHRKGRPNTPVRTWRDGHNWVCGEYREVLVIYRG